MAAGQGEVLHVWRCAECGRVLAYYLPVPGLIVRVVCKRCREEMELRIPAAA